MGYYSYENPYKPNFPGQEKFKGRIVHPQQWDEDCDKQIKDRVANTFIIRNIFEG